MNADFARIAGLGLNTVRMFVPFATFGGAQTDAAQLDNLDDLLQRAEAHGLKVIVTLFDFRTDYRPYLWAAAERQLEALARRFANSTAILAWDIKNEPDRDYRAAGPDMVDAWLRHTASLLRSLDRQHLITIGWSTPEAALADDFSDFVSFHFYAPPAELPAAYEALRGSAGSRPLLLQEFGLPTWNSFFFPNGHSQPEQAEYYADVIAASRVAGSGYMAWTLYDFARVPTNVAGGMPWQTGPQANLGVLQADGSAKPAAALLAPGSSLEVTRVPGWARLLKPFWFTVLGCCCWAC